MINSSGNIVTGNTTSSSFTCGALNANSISTLGALSAGTTTLGNLTAGSISGQNITLGNTTGMIKLISSNIFTPTGSNNNILMINSSGNIVTSEYTNSNFRCNNLLATSMQIQPVNSSDSIQLGITGTIGINSISFLAGAEPMLIQANGSNANLKLSTTGSINLSSPSIVLPSTANSTLGWDKLLLINSSGNIITESKCFALNVDTLNANTLNALSTLTAQNSTLGSLTAAVNTGEIINLGNATGTITITSSGITNPTGSDKNLLMINSSGNIVTGNTTSSSFTCGALNANSISTLGALSAGNTTVENLTASNITTAGNIAANSLYSQAIFSTGATNMVSLGDNPADKNGIIFINNQSDLLIGAGNTGSNLKLSSNTNINVASPKIFNSSSVNNGNFLMVDTNGNIYTQQSQVKSGSISCYDLIAAPYTLSIISLGVSGWNSIIFNSSSGDVKIEALIPDSSLYLSSSAGTNSKGIVIAGKNITWPGSGNSQLYINSNGSITTTASSITYKEKINNLSIDSNSFDLLQPVSFYYIDDHTKQLQYGFIAEDLENIPTLKETVIYGHDKKPISINYQAVFVALTADYLATKKALQQSLQQKDNDLNTLTTTCKSLKEELNQKSIIIKELQQKCDALSIAIAKIISEISQK